MPKGEKGFGVSSFNSFSKRVLKKPLFSPTTVISSMLVYM
jgi:hypothetical protein